MEHEQIYKPVEKFLSSLGVYEPEHVYTKEFAETVKAFIYLECNSFRIFERGLIMQSILDDVRGFGPLEWCLRNSEVEEILVFGVNRIMSKRTNQKSLKKEPQKFLNEKQYDRVVQKIMQAKNANGDILRRDQKKLNAQFTEGTGDGPHFRLIKVKPDDDTTSGVRR